jgi:C_GCAxxG_C_C family probable redox protein
MDKAQKAFDTMANRKMNCAQTVFSVFSKEYGLTEGQALAIAQSFGSGMRVNGVCGAVTGAYMVLGLANPPPKENPRQSMDKTNALAAEFNRKFEELYGSICCTDLLGYSLTNPEEAAEAREKGLFVTKCPEFVRDAVKIVESLLKEK